jgi:hypothetical protein
LNLRVPLVVFKFLLGGVSSGWMALGGGYSIYTTTIYITVPDDIKEGKASVSLNFFSYGIYNLVNYYMRADEGTSVMKDEERAAVGVGRPPPVERMEDICRGGRLT